MTTRKVPTTERRSARDRLLAAADELFYEGGIHSVGIDRVIERAGVAKASLYDCFGSKDELIRSYLQARHEARKARLTAKLARYDTPRERLLGVFDAMGELMAEPNFRGCAFARAGAESRPGGGVKDACVDARDWMLDLFIELARDAGAQLPAELARQLVMLYDGASVAAQMDGAAGMAAAARAAAALLLEAAIEPAARSGKASAQPRRVAVRSKRTTTAAA
ncbi:MAG: helix-turn-helix domain-containing protein [Caldimonas sp.]